ncbi:MAG: c-type cytochrome [Nibricoccus sp.]
MRKLLKYTVWALAGIILLIVVAATTVYLMSNSRLRRTYRITANPLTIPNDPAAIEQGRHIAQTRGCIDCHGADFAGAKVVENVPIGRLYGPNLTRGNGGLAANFSDEDWVRAIRHGVSKEGRPLFLMPSQEFSHFSDEDLGALIAYLKTVAPVDRARVPIALGPVGRVLVVTGKFPIAAEVIDHANLKPASVKVARSVDYGRYLAAGCAGCHGSNYSGGPITGAPPDWPAAANLTTHEKAAVANWSETDFINTLRTGRRPNGTEISPVMPRAFGQMNDTELGALWLFLKNLPAAATGSR